MIKNFLILLLMFCFSFGFFGEKTVAQSGVTGDIKVTPENPEPKSKVTLTFNTYDFDPDFALITWKINGETLLSGVGEKNFVITTGDIGEVITVTMTASTETGFFIEKRLTLTPASVSLLYEAPKSYVPHFYEGRSQAGVAGEVKVTAFPFIGTQGVMTDPSSLSYTWYVNGAILKDSSGKGKQSTRTGVDYLRSKTEVRVVVKGPNAISATKTITITPKEIVPTLYEYDELFGTLFEKRLGKRYETTKDFTVILEPYYVSTSMRNNQKTPQFTWYLNAMNITPLGGRIMTFNVQSYGTKKLSIDVYGPDKRLQKSTLATEFVFDARK